MFGEGSWPFALSGLTVILIALSRVVHMMVEGRVDVALLDIRSAITPIRAATMAKKIRYYRLFAIHRVFDAGLCYAMHDDEGASSSAIRS